MATWSDVMPGDIVRTAAGRYRVEHVRDGKVIMVDEKGLTHAGQPDPSGPVTIERRGTPEEETALQLIERVLGARRLTVLVESH